MEVLVDGWELLPGEKRRGIGRFLEGVLPALAARDDVTVAVLQAAQEVDEIPLPAGCRARPVTRRAPRGRVRAGTVEHVARLVRELAAIPHDVAWSPGTLPFVASRQPWVQTIHDLAPLVLGLPGHRFERRHWQLLRRRVAHADAVVAVSRFAAHEAMVVLGLGAAAIEVVPHGIDEVFTPLGPIDPAGPYVAAVASDDPRKGVHELVEVAAQLSAAGIPLHVAGALSDAGAAPLTAAGAVVRGHLEDLPTFLRGARTVVVPSRYEGFGFVPLEAMACGATVVAFDTSAIPEVVGDAGILVRDGDAAALAAATAELWRDDAATAELRHAGLERAATFRWRDAARGYAEIFGRVANGHG